MSDLRIQKQNEEVRFLREQTTKLSAENQLFSPTAENAEIYAKRHYSFLERKENVISWSFGNGNEISEQAEPAVEAEESQIMQEHRKLSKAEKNVVAQEKKLFDKQKKLVQMRQNSFETQETGQETKARADAEVSYLNEKLKLINLQAEADLEKARSDMEKLEIDVNKKQAKVDAWTDFVKLLKIGSVDRQRAIKRKEQAQIDLYWAKYKLKLEKMGPAERKAENVRYMHKVFEDYAKAVFSHSDVNCQEDHIIETKINGKDLKLMNMGRAFLGGTKPTYYYKDMESGKLYLYKKAENCCGLSKPEGAIVTEIGGKLQHIVDPEHEIPAAGIKNAEGKYVGSIQELQDIKEKQDIDFDFWQLGDVTKGAQKPETVQNPEVQKQLLIFHCVDWLLCNFDTKGEHLLQRNKGDFVSIDKEGGMNQILNQAAQSMNCTFRPHHDEPVYNLFFRMFRDNKIDISHEALDALEEKVQIIENYPEKEYMQMFEPYIRQVNKEPARMRENILRRKRNLRVEYNRFLSSLRAGTRLREH